jgi:hypothetical protein
MSFNVTKIVANMLTSYTIESGFHHNKSNDEIFADSTTKLILRDIEVTQKDAIREWKMVHVAVCIGDNPNPFIFKTQVEKPKLETTGNYTYVVEFTAGVSVTTSGKVSKVAVVATDGAEIFAVGTYKLKFDVIKRSLKAQETTLI